MAEYLALVKIISVIEGGRPGQGLPGVGDGGRPDHGFNPDYPGQGLPGYPGGPDQGFNPNYPDQGFNPNHPDQSLPGGGHRPGYRPPPRPEGGGGGGSTGQLPWLPVYPDQGGPDGGGGGEKPGQGLPSEPGEIWPPLEGNEKPQLPTGALQDKIVVLAMIAGKMRYVCVDIGGKEMPERPDRPPQPGQGLPGNPQRPGAGAGTLPSR